MESEQDTNFDTRSISESITTESFDEWYTEHTFAQNLKNGTPWRNRADRVPEPEEHYPHQLLQCHRKIYYRQLNAPEETASPDGLFWMGSRIEEDVMLPYLEWLVSPQYYVGNSFWVSYDFSVDGTDLIIKGSTDPLVVDEQSSPQLLTEVKTKASLTDFERPPARHKAQLHAYLYGLSQESDDSVTEGVLIYVDRKTFAIRSVRVPFDVDFWRDTVLDWMTTQTEYRRVEHLPPGEPTYEGECTYCSFRQRCGEGEEQFEDLGVTGFVPLYVKYPRSKVQDHLDAHDQDQVKLTPALAHRYPDLAEDYDVHQWHCTVCSTAHQWNGVEWDGNVEQPPLCPECRANDIPAPLTGPAPSASGSSTMEETDA